MLLFPSNSLAWESGFPLSTAVGSSKRHIILSVPGTAVQGYLTHGHKPQGSGALCFPARQTEIEEQCRSVLICLNVFQTLPPHTNPSNFQRRACTCTSLKYPRVPIPEVKQPDRSGYYCISASPFGSVTQVCGLG